MSEYWVSQAKHYCKVCNVWIADTKLSRSHHEGGVKHKINVDMLNKKKRNEKLHGAHSEEDLKKQMQMIDRAAHDAILNDRNNICQEASSGSQRPVTFNITGTTSKLNLPKSLSQKTLDAITENLRESDNGLYKVGDQSFLEGSLNEELMRHGVKCQLFIEDLDEWVNALIESRIDIAIPHTTQVLRSYKVSYSPSGLPGQDTGTVTEDKVKSDRLRLFASDKGQAVLTGDVFEQALTGAALVPVERHIDAATGMGGWSTVSVITVNEEEEEIKREAERAIKAEAKQSAKAKKQQELELLYKESAEQVPEDLCTVDTATGQLLYRGVLLSSESGRSGFQAAREEGEPLVGFKKRKPSECTVIKTEAEGDTGEVLIKLEENAVAVTAQTKLGVDVAAKKKRQIRQKDNDE